MVGIHVIRLVPAQRLYRFIGGFSGAGRVGADDHVFPIRLVPYGNDIHALSRPPSCKPQLRFRLMRKTVANSYGVLRKQDWIRHGIRVVRGASLLPQLGIMTAGSRAVKPKFLNAIFSKIDVNRVVERVCLSLHWH